MTLKAAFVTTFQEVKGKMVRKNNVLIRETDLHANFELKKSEIKNSLERPSRKMNMTEERVSEPEVKLKSYYVI